MVYLCLTGYVRLILLAIGWYYIDQSAIFALLYGTSATLDCNIS